MMNITRNDGPGPETGAVVEHHKGKAGEKGWEGKNHWHVKNPDQSNKKQKRLDADGNPVKTGRNAAHHEPGTTVTLPNTKTKDES